MRLLRKWEKRGSITFEKHEQGWAEDKKSSVHTAKRWRLRPLGGPLRKQSWFARLHGRPSAKRRNNILVGARKHERALIGRFCVLWCFLTHSPTFQEVDHTAFNELCFFALRRCCSQCVGHGTIIVSCIRHAYWFIIAQTFFIRMIHIEMCFRTW